MSPNSVHHQPVSRICDAALVVIGRTSAYARIMALLSNMVPLGTPLPDVTLPRLDGSHVGLAQIRGSGCLLVVFAANHCPYVRHVESALGALVAEFGDEPLTVVAIGSNDVAQYPDDDAEHLREQQHRAGWNFPYLIDEDQSAARAFRAACTPDFFLYDSDGVLAYRGAFDASTPKNGEPLTGDMLRNAITATMNGEPVPAPHKPAMGCGIKWKPGNEPS